MELCTTTRCIPNQLPNIRPLTPCTITLQWKLSLPFKPSITRNNPGSRYCNFSSIKATTSEETSGEANQYAKEGPDGVVMVDEVQSEERNGFEFQSEEKNGFEVQSEEKNGFEVQSEEKKGFEVQSEEKNGFEVQSEEKNGFEVQSEEKNGFGIFGLMKDVTVADDQFSQFDFLNKLNMELDFEDSLSIALLGGGGVAALWLTASIVGAIDNIPLFPKLMEVVGLGYTIWFSTRYLLFKKTRDELASKVEEIKQQVLGPKN